MALESDPELVTKPVKKLGVEELLEKLDWKKRTILLLYYFEQFQVSEISTILKIPPGTVKSRLHAARNDLKMLWQQSSPS